MKQSFAFLILIFIIFNTAAWAVKDSIRNKKETDTTYIDDYYYTLTTWFNTFSKNNRISIYDKQRPSSLSYVPNLSACFGPGIGYKWAAVDFAFISTRPLDKNLYGSTSKLDIQGHFHMKKFLINGNLQYYKGFYLENYPDSAGIFRPDSTPYVRPDIQQVSCGASLLYAFNWDKYSLAASFSQSQRQKKSKGTWVIGGQMTFFTVGADSNFIPSAVRPYMDSSAYLSGIGSFNIGITGGYLYTFVYKNWYVTGALIPGFGRQTYIYALLNDTVPHYDNSRTAGKFYGRLSLGYNGPRFYSGISVIAETSDFKNSTPSYVSHNFSVARFFVGYRFFIRKRKILFI